jgi:N-acetylglucosaminyl-diphospho-decaprenol L-rhamnosyltransferase
MAASPILSIIVVAYKSRDEIAGCLGSLPSQLEGRPVEVVVVDNSPGDGTGEIVRREFPGVVYLPAPSNLGFGRANNLGYARTSGEFVLFLNPDTISNAPALAHGVARLRADKRLGLISPRLELADGSMDLACRRSIPTLWDGFCRASGLAARFPNVSWLARYNLTDRPTDGT